MPVTSITIEGELYSAKNHMQIIPNRSRKANAQPYFLIKSSVAKRADIGIQAQLLALREEWRTMIEGTSRPLALRFKIFRQTRRRFDYVNIIQSLLDNMTRCKWIEDDSANHVIPVFDQYEVDSKRPRVEIAVLGSGSDIILTKEQLTFL